MKYIFGLTIIFAEILLTKLEIFTQKLMKNKIVLLPDLKAYIILTSIYYYIYCPDFLERNSLQYRIIPLGQISFHLHTQTNKAVPFILLFGTP